METKGSKIVAEVRRRMATYTPEQRQLLEREARRISRGLAPCDHDECGIIRCKRKPSVLGPSS